MKHMWTISLILLATIAVAQPSDQAHFRIFAMGSGTLILDGPTAYALVDFKSEVQNYQVIVTRTSYPPNLAELYVLEDPLGFAVISSQAEDAGSTFYWFAVEKEQFPGFGR
jgi:hypothetical protein